MKKRLVSFGMAFVLLITVLIPIFHGFAQGDEPSFSDRVVALQTLDEALLLAQDIKQVDYPSEVWSQLQSALETAETLSLIAGYVAIRADVESGHVNENRYLSRVGSSGASGGVSAVLRYKGHGSTADEKSAFDDDQIWQARYTDETHTTFTLCNLEGNYFRVSTTKSGNGRLVRVGALSSNVSEAYFTLKDGDENSGILAPVDQKLYSDYVIDFTTVTHTYADTASSRPSNIMLARAATAITVRNRCVFEGVDNYNTELESNKTALLESIKALLLQQLAPASFEERVESLDSLSDAIVLVDSMEQNYFRGEVWSQLQTVILAARKLNRNAGYVTIRADVESGHVNTDRYLSRVGSSGDNGGTCAVVRYKGHGSTAGEKTAFDSDQIWKIFYIDDTYTTFTLCNLEGNYLCVSSTDYQQGKLLRILSALSSNASAYFVLKDPDDTGSAVLTTAPESNYSDLVVDFTKMTHEYADNATNRPSNLMIARPASTITSRNRCVFEEMTGLNADLLAEKAQMIETIKALLLQKMEEPLNAETVLSLEEALFVAENADEDQYSATTWVELQEAIAEAKELSAQQGQFVIGAGVAAGQHNEGRYITASGGHYDSYMTLRYRGKGDSIDEVSSFTNDQIWLKFDVEGMQDVFTLQNLSNGKWLSTGNAIGGVGYVVVATATPDPVECSYWTIKNGMLYAVDHDGVMDQAVDFTKVTDHVLDTQKEPRTDNYFHTRNASAITYRSEALFTRLSNIANSNLDNSKEELMTRIVNILRRTNGSALGNLSDLYNDILENDSSLNYSETDYASLTNAMALSLATLQSKLYRVEMNGKSAFADSDGTVRFAKTDDENISQLWSRESVAGSTDKDNYYSFCNAIYGTYMYQSDEQNPAFAGIADFGWYVKHAALDALGDETDRTLFIYSDQGNLLPKINNSATASEVSLNFKEIGGDNKVFSDAGQSPEKAAQITQVTDVDVMMYIADQCYQTLTALRAKRIDDAETFTAEDLRALIKQAEQKIKNADDYSAGSVETLSQAMQNAKTVLSASGSTTADRNFAGNALKKAINDLAERAKTSTSSYKARLLAAIAALESVKNATDDTGAALYCAPCVAAAEKQLTAARKVLSNVKATYANVDDMIDALQAVTDNMVLNKNYSTLFQNLEGVRYRDETQYQPATWKPLYTFYQKSEKVYQAITRYTNSDIVNLNTEFSTYLQALQKRATLTTVEALVNMLNNLNLKKSSFTTETWEPYERYLAKASALLKDADAQQDSIDSVVGSLVVAAGNLCYSNNDGSVGLFPNVLIGYPQNVRDRYQEGYLLGSRWGAYDGYNAAYQEGYDQTMKVLGGLPQAATEPENDLQEEPPVREVTQTVTTVTERFYQPGGLPGWLLYVLIGSGVALFAVCGLVGFLVAKKRNSRKAAVQTAPGTEDVK